MDDERVVGGRVDATPQSQKARPAESRTAGPGPSRQRPKVSRWARPELYPTDSILDAASGVVLERGLGAATIAAIAESSGAPVGSIYHRFGSVDDLLARMWIRAVRRSQERFAAAAEDPDPTEGAVGAALSVYDYCVKHPADGRLLLSYRPEDLAGGRIHPKQRTELERLNDPVAAVVKDLARRLYGRAS